MGDIAMSDDEPRYISAGEWWCRYFEWCESLGPDFTFACLDRSEPRERMNPEVVKVWDRHIREVAARYGYSWPEPVAREQVIQVPTDDERRMYG